MDVGMESVIMATTAILFHPESDVKEMMMDISLSDREYRTMSVANISVRTTMRLTMMEKMPQTTVFTIPRIMKHKSEKSHSTIVSMIS